MSDQVPNLGTPNIDLSIRSLVVTQQSDFADRPRLTSAADVSNALAATPVSWTTSPYVFKVAGYYMMTYKIWLAGAAGSTGGVKFSLALTGAPTVFVSVVKSLIALYVQPQSNVALAGLSAITVCTFDLSSSPGWAEIDIGINAAVGASIDLLFAPAVNTQNVTVKAGSQLTGIHA